MTEREKSAKAPQPKSIGEMLRGRKPQLDTIRFSNPPEWFRLFRRKRR